MRKIETLISSAFAAYYHIPAVWCGDIPTDIEWKKAPENELIRNIFEKTLSNGIRVRVRRDGLFVFDFSKLPSVAETEIPGYEIEAGKQTIIPKEVVLAERAAEQKAHYRTLLMNVHQACINTAHTEVHRRSTELGKLISSSMALVFYDFEFNGNSEFYLTNDPFQRYLITQTTLTPAFRFQHQEIRNRRLLELDTISYSFSLFEKIMGHKFSELPLLVEMIYRAGISFSDNHFADSLVLGWTVCERLVNSLWEAYLSERKVNKDESIRINNDRLKKLTGRDFTASIISETLELSGSLQ